MIKITIKKFFYIAKSIKKILNLFFAIKIVITLYKTKMKYLWKGLV